MPDSPPRKKLAGLLPNRPDTKALNKLLDKLSSVKRSPNKSVKARSLSSPTAKKYHNDSSQSTLNNWLSKPKVIKKDFKYQKSIEESLKPLKISTTKVEKSSEKVISDVKRSSKRSGKPTLNRFNSESSDELPTFKKKTLRTRTTQTESFKKYGVIVPSLDEIVAAQQEFSNYKTRVAEAQTLREPTFKMLSSPQKSNLSEDKLLDCKHLTIEEVTKYFKNNLPLLRDIINGKKYCDRHRRYFDKKNKLDVLTTRDLTYSISTIVFNFEQVDHMITLMRNEFDPDDHKTSYFFKVLVPELCLKIFMEVYNMNKREATTYLENRPIQ